MIRRTIESSRSSTAQSCSVSPAGCSSSPVGSPAATTSSSTRSEARAATTSPTQATASTRAEAPRSAPALDALLAQHGRDQDRQRHREDHVGRARARDRSGRARARRCSDADLTALGARARSRCASIATRRSRRCSSSRRKYDKCADRRVPRSRRAHDPRRRAGPGHRRRGARCRASPRPRARARRRSSSSSVPVPGARRRRPASASTTSRTCSATTRRSSRSPTRIATSTSSSPRRKINGDVLKPGEEWSFNGTVGERSQNDGYKIAHVITAGEMVDGLAGGTCQISTTLFGASFFAGLDIVKTTQPLAPERVHAARLRRDGRVARHRPRAQEPVRLPGRDALPRRERRGAGRDPRQEAPVRQGRVRARGARGDAVRDRGAPRRGDAGGPDDARSGRLQRLQARSASAASTRARRWSASRSGPCSYKPVTEYMRRGTNTDPNAQMPKEKEIHRLKAPNESEVHGREDRPGAVALRLRPVRVGDVFGIGGRRGRRLGVAAVRVRLRARHRDV